MLASRGFVYLTRETASLGGGFHNGRCDCNVVPSWGERHIAGYDPDALYRQYKSCADTISNLTTQDKYKDYLSALSDKEKAKALNTRNGNATSNSPKCDGATAHGSTPAHRQRSVITLRNSRGKYQTSARTKYELRSASPTTE